MGKLPAFQFYPNDWRTDPNLCRVSKSARDTWMDMLCMMFHCDERGFLVTAGKAWSDREIAGSARGQEEANLADITELLDKGVAHRDSRGAVYSKRMVRDEETRRQTKNRVNKHRNGLVTEQKRLITEDEDETEVLDFDFELASQQIYELYPRKVKKPEALKAIKKAIARESQKLGSIEAAVVYLKVQTEKYDRSPAVRGKKEKGEADYIPYPATWFNAESYNDEADWGRPSREVGTGPAFTRAKDCRDHPDSGTAADGSCWGCYTGKPKRGQEKA